VGRRSDFVWIREDWLYLAVLLDLYSRRVVGWAMGQRLTVELAEQALMMALKPNSQGGARPPLRPTTVSQYAATSYQCLLTGYGLIPSMSRKGNRWDNACVEAKRDIFEYIGVVPSDLSALNPRLSLPG
jgi:transposase InsO family protein